MSETKDFERAFSEKLGKRLKELRKEKKLTQEAVARRADIATYTYQKFEKGESKPGTPMNPTLFTLMRLCEVLGVGLTDLLDIQIEVGDPSVEVTTEYESEQSHSE